MTTTTRARITKATMRIQHKPGDEMEVDWAGATIDIYDEVTGEISPAYLFVAVLSCSLYVYAELCPNMKSDTFINCPCTCLYILWWIHTLINPG